jgi:hypothetical protein
VCIYTGHIKNELFNKNKADRYASKSLQSDDLLYLGLKTYEQTSRLGFSVRLETLCEIL